MAYAQNAFGVTSFGESTEPTDVTVTLTGVSGSIDVNGAALGVASISRVIIGGVEGTLQVGTVGIGMGVVPTGVSATGAAGAITVDGGVGTTPTITMSTAFTASLGGITVDAGFGPTIQPVGFGLEAITDSPLVTGDEVIVESDANISLAGKGVSATTANNTVTLDCKAVVVPTGVQGTFTVGDETINAVQFDYESIKDDYSRQRTVYISAASSNTNTSYVRAA